MLWHTSIAPQRPAPRGEVATRWYAGSNPQHVLPGSAARVLGISERFDSTTTGRRT